MNYAFKSIFLFSSFGPLYLVFSVKLYYAKCLPWYVSGSFFGAFVLSICAFYFAAFRMRRGVSRFYKVSDVKTKDAEVFPYIMSYIPPLIFRDVSTPDIYIPLLILYALICLLYLRLDAPYLNPYFLIFSYRIYEAKLEPSRNVVTIIARHRPVSGSEDVKMIELSSGVYYCE